MKVLCISLVIVSSILLTANAQLSVRDVSHGAQTIHQNAMETFTFSIDLSTPRTVRAFVYDQELKVVRQFHSNKFEKKHSFEWDLKTDDGTEVAAGLYFYRFQITDREGTTIDRDPLYRTGGRDVSAFWPRWQPETETISFDLGRDSLVRVRVGIKEGPMIVTAAEWIPVAKRNANVKWDGWDTAHNSYYGSHSNLYFVVDAMTLPDNYVHVKGPENASTVSFAGAGWLKDIFAFKKDFGSRKYSHVASVVGTIRETSSVSIETPFPLDNGVFNLKQSESIVVTVPNIDEQERDNQTYEVLFYVDGRYLKEDMVNASSAHLDLHPGDHDPGSHTLVANVILGSGRVGTASLKFRVD